MNPLILSLELDPDLATELTRWRARYFPAERNYLDAHVTLFHALPATRHHAIVADLGELAATQSEFAVRVPAAYSLGRGVALEVVAPEIAKLRRDLRARWLDHLTPQDRTAAIRPHVTIQNKVGGDQAKRTLAEVRAAWPAHTAGTARGLALWEYLGGPWRALTSFRFQPI